MECRSVLRSPAQPIMCRGNAAVRVHVICREEQFYLDVPHEVLSLGPWSVISRGEVSELAAEHRLTLARQGYVVIEAHMLGFEKA